MVKGIQRQVIVVQSPDRNLFEQAIFILRDGQKGISDEALLKEAKQIIGSSGHPGQMKWYSYGLAWAIVGGLLSSIIWVAALFL